MLTNRILPNLECLGPSDRRTQRSPPWHITAAAAAAAIGKNPGETKAVEEEGILTMAAEVDEGGGDTCRSMISAEQ